MTPWLDDGDIRLYHGDALETVRAMPDAYLALAAVAVGLFWVLTGLFR